MTKPLLLVDVDGCLNVTGWGPIGHEDVGEHIELCFEATSSSPVGNSGTFTIRTPRGVVDRIKRLEPLFECVWATTWMGAATTELAPHFGFGADWEFITLERKGYPRDSWTWKLPSATEWDVDPTRPLAWIDDDFEGDAERWAINRPGRTLLAQCSYNVGFTEELAVELEAFARDSA